VLDVILAESGSADADAEPSVPALEVVVGEPSAEELAALVAVLTAVARPAPVPEDPEDSRVDSWAALWRGIGAPVPLGPGAWGAGSVG
jgi:Acyl-CoA carboxylase epsilon subunit